MIDAPLAYAFGVGMVATVNPCGFAMLPAYLSFFLGLEEADDDTRASVLHALVIGATVTAGFLRGVRRCSASCSTGRSARCRTGCRG